MLGVVCGALALHGTARGWRVFDVATFGARGDGRTNSTAAIRTAAAALRRAGGGELLFGPGTFVTGSFNLSSNSVLKVQGRSKARGSWSLFCVATRAIKFWFGATIARRCTTEL